MRLKEEVSVFLDLIRGISAQLVLIGHLLSFYKVKGFDTDTGGFVMQNFGVVIFFILSGFLIMYSISSKKENYKFTDFFIDRFSRIFIAFIPALFVILVCDIVITYFDETFIYKNADTVKNFVGNTFMLQDHPFFTYGISKIDKDFSFSSFGSGRPLWTVAVEWWIYMFFGFMVFKKPSIRNVLVFCFLFIVPLYNMTGGGNGLSVVWFLGALGYAIFKEYDFKPRNTILVVILLLAAALFRLRMNKYEVYDLTFSAPLTFAIIFYIKYLQDLSVRNWLFVRLERFSKLISSYSFSLYLIHYSVIMLIMSLKIDMNKWVLMGATFLLCNLLAWVFAYFTEFRYHSFRHFIKNKYKQYAGA